MTCTRCYAPLTPDTNVPIAGIEFCPDCAGYMRSLMHQIRELHGQTGNGCCFNGWAFLIVIDEHNGRVILSARCDASDTGCEGDLLYLEHIAIPLAHAFQAASLPPSSPCFLCHVTAASVALAFISCLSLHIYPP